MIDPRSLSLDPKDWIRTKADEKWIRDGGFIDPTQFYKLTDFCRDHLRILLGDDEGEPFYFFDWFLRDILFPLYAFKRKDKTRRYRTGGCFTPKKVGKTTSWAAVIIFELIQHATESYVLSSSLGSSDAMFKAICDLIQTSPTLKQETDSRTGKKKNRDRRRPWIQENLRRIIFDRSEVRIVSGNPEGKSGQNISLLLVEELCEIQDLRPYERMRHGGKFRKEPIVPFFISTPLYDRNSLAGQVWDECEAILSGKSERTDFLAVIHGVPADVDFHDENNWWKYLAGLGNLVDKDRYREEYENAKKTPREMVAFRNYFLCQWSESYSTWLDMNRYREQVKEIDLAELKGKRVWLALDGAFTGLACLILFFPDEKIVYPYYWIPQETAIKHDAKFHTNYQAWAAAGFVEMTAGDLFDWQTIYSRITAISQQFEVIELLFDPWSLEGRMSEVQNDFSFPVIPIPPTKNYVARPTLHLERLVYSKQLTFHANPILEWNASVARVKSNAHDMIVLDREQVPMGARYDGIASLVLCLQRYLQHQEEGLTLENGIILL